MEPTTQDPAGGDAAFPPNVAAMLAYSLGFFTGVLFLLLKAYRCQEFIRFHAFQSILYSLSWILVIALWNLLATMLTVLAYRTLGFALGGLVASLFVVSNLTILVTFVGVWAFLLSRAYHYHQFELPFLGEWARQLAE